MVRERSTILRAASRERPVGTGIIAAYEPAGLDRKGVAGTLLLRIQFKLAL